MKNLKLFSFALLAVVFALGTSCGKYEEGPGFSLRTKTARIAGEWKAEKFVFANGTTVNADADDNSTWIIEKDGTFTLNSTDGGQSFTLSGTWQFTKDKEYFEMTLSFFGQTDVSESKIVRLTNSEFWFEDEDGDQTHLIPA